MARATTSELDWSLSTLCYSAVASVVGLLFGLGVARLPFMPEFWLGPFLFGGLWGAFAVFVMHPRRLFVTLLVIAPVMSFLLLAGTILFRIYVLGEPVEF